MAELTYDDFKNKLSIQNVLIDAGYTLNRRDGLRYPSYVRLDSEGRRIRGGLALSVVCKAGQRGQTYSW